MSIRSNISKEIGLDEKCIVIPTMEVAQRIVARAEKGPTERDNIWSYARIFELLRFGKPGTDPAALAVINYLYTEDAKMRHLYEADVNPTVMGRRE